MTSMIMKTIKSIYINTPIIPLFQLVERNDSSSILPFLRAARLAQVEQFSSSSFLEKLESLKLETQSECLTTFGSILILQLQGLQLILLSRDCYLRERSLMMSIALFDCQESETLDLDLRDFCSYLLGEPAVGFVGVSFPFIRVYKFNQLAQILQSNPTFPNQSFSLYMGIIAFIISRLFIPASPPSSAQPSHYSLELLLYQFSMKNSRPFTALRQNRNSKIESKPGTGQARRPLSAKSDSLKRIIQVIQNTLSKGAQTLQVKTKTLEKFSKVKNQSLDFSHFKLFKLRPKYDREIPQFRTEFLISNASEATRSTPTIKSSKKLFTSHENDEFVPYMKQQPLLDGQEHSRREGVPLKKVGRRRANVKQNGKTESSYDLCEIDKWQNESSILNMSYLLNQQKY